MKTFRITLTRTVKMTKTVDVRADTEEEAVVDVTRGYVPVQWDDGIYADRNNIDYVTVKEGTSC